MELFVCEYGVVTIGIYSSPELPNISTDWQSVIISRATIPFTGANVLVTPLQDICCEEGVYVTGTPQRLKVMVDAEPGVN